MGPRGGREPRVPGGCGSSGNREGCSCCSDHLYLEDWRLRAAGASAMIWEDAGRQLPGWLCDGRLSCQTPIVRGGRGGTPSRLWQEGLGVSRPRECPPGLVVWERGPDAGPVRAPGTVTRGTWL